MYLSKDKENLWSLLRIHVPCTKSLGCFQGSVSATCPPGPSLL